jgi:hypothetical protein
MRLSVCALTVLVTGSSLPFTGQGPYSASSTVIRQLLPSAFPDLPVDFKSQLEAHGCTIPQWGWDEKRKVENVIKGDFAEKGQLDWAALCYKAGQSSILLFWGKRTACPSELAVTADESVVEGESGPSFTGWTFLRAIRPAKPPFPTLNHSAISDVWGTHFSYLRYCSHGKWYQIENAVE